MLSHFKHQHELFPRKIMTAKSNGQIEIEFNSNEYWTIERMLEYFKKANYVDCRINSFPSDIEYHLDLEVKNKIAADFVFIDLDLHDFEGKEKLDKILKKTLTKINGRLQGANPTVIWTGNGYHIYQPLNGFVLEKEMALYKFLPYVERDLTSEFLRFSERFFTGGRSDNKHKPSIKSCLIRIPGTFNSKNDDEVKIIQRWDGVRPDIRWILSEFRIHLIQKMINVMKERKKAKSNLTDKRVISNNYGYPESNSIPWMDILLQTPIHDYRKFCLWRVLIPYLINIKKLSNDEIYIILIDWLDKCNQERKLDFNANMKIKSDLKHAKKYLPLSLNTLKKTENGLFRLLVTKNIVSE